MVDEMMVIVICKHCGKPEYYGEMRWLSGKCCCRDCYRHDFESREHKPYTWADLNGRRPTMKEYTAQEDDYCAGCTSPNCSGCVHQHEESEEL